MNNVLKTILVGVLIFSVGLLLQYNIKYFRISLIILLFYIFCNGIFVQLKKTSEIIYKKIKVVLIRVDNIDPNDYRSETCNIVLTLKEISSGKEYKDYRFSIDKPEVGLEYYIDVAINNPDNYQVRNHRSGVKIDLRLFYIGIYILCVIFLLVALYGYRSVLF